VRVGVDSDPDADAVTDSDTDTDTDTNTVGPIDDVVKGSGGLLRRYDTQVSLGHPEARRCTRD